MATLVNVAGPAMGACYPIGDKRLLSIGREDDCTFQIRDAYMSRHHLQIGVLPGGDGHYAADHRTANGTYVNGERIMDKTPLKDGDTIRLGNTTLMYRTEDFADAETAMKQSKNMSEWKHTTQVD